MEFIRNTNNDSPVSEKSLQCCVHNSDTKKIKLQFIKFEVFIFPCVLRIDYWIFFIIPVKLRL